MVLAEISCVLYIILLGCLLSEGVGTSVFTKNLGKCVGGCRCGGGDTEATVTIK